MKKYRQLVQELPSKKVVMAFGRFQPPTIGHELLVNAVKKIAQKQQADHIIFASRSQDKKSNPLPVDRKVYYLKRMFPKTNFVAANEEIRTFIEAAGALSKKYKHLVMLAGSDRVPEYKRILEKYNGTDAFKFETIEVVSAGERDPDADTASGMSGTKMREAAKKGDYQLFKKGLPHALTDIDGKRLMNEIRQGLGMDVIKEHIKFERNELREKYHAGKIFNVGDKVTDGESTYEVVDRGANYITVVNESGSISKKWLDSVQPTHIEEDVLPGPAPEEISFKGYKTKNLHHSEDATKAFQTTIQRYNAGQIKDAVAILNALKATDTYMKVNDLHLEQGEAPDKADLALWHDAHEKARESLNRIGEFMHHFDYWHMHEHEIQGMETNYTPATQGAEFADSVKLEGQLTEMKFSSSDKIKVARVIASALGLEDVEKTSNPEQLINNALRKVRSKPMRPEYVEVLHKMLQTAKEAEIKYDEKLVPQKVAEEVVNELSTDLLARYKKKSSEASTAADKAGDYTKGHKRYKGILKATIKQFDNDAKKVTKEETEIADLIEAIANAKLLGKDTTDLTSKLKDVRRATQSHTEPDNDDLGGVSDNDNDNTNKDNQSDVDAEVQPISAPVSKVGSSMTHAGENPSVRKMKINYVHEQTDDSEQLAKESDKATLKAKQAKEKEELAIKQQSERDRISEAVPSTTEDDMEELDGENPGGALTKTVGVKSNELPLKQPGYYKEEAEDVRDDEELDKITDKDLDSMADSIDTIDDIIDVYDDDELVLIDEDTGEYVGDLKEEALDEVLSRMERIKAKTRFAKTQAKRTRKVKIALKSRSSLETINKRARKLAVNLMKMRLAKKPLSKLSIGEKERIEKTLQRRKQIINRLAMKLAPRVRKIENDRLAHKSK